MTEPKLAIFRDADHARAALEAARWPDGPVCPHCGSRERIVSGRGRTVRAGLYRCGGCKRQFTVTVQTLFEGSKIPLHKWWLATHLMGANDPHVSINELHRQLGVTYKTAWQMARRLRKAPHYKLQTRAPRTVHDLSAGTGIDKRKNAKSPKAGRSKILPVPTRTLMLMTTLLAQGRESTEKRRTDLVSADRDAETKKRDPRSTRTAILEVACNLLAKDGHVGLSLTEVAQLAGVNRGDGLSPLQDP